MTDAELLTEARRLWNLPVIRQHVGSRPLPPITIRRSARKVGTSGNANRQRVILTVGSDQADALTTLLHEIIHAALGRCETGWHGDPFYRVFRSAVREAWPDVAFAFNQCTATRGHKLHRWTADRLRFNLPTSQPASSTTISSCTSTHATTAPIATSALG